MVVSILQVQGDTESAFVEQGMGSGKFSLLFPYHPDVEISVSTSRWHGVAGSNLFLECNGASSLLGVLGGFLLLSSLFGGLRKDIVAVSEYGNKLIVGSGPEFLMWPLAIWTQWHAALSVPVNLPIKSEKTLLLSLLPTSTKSRSAACSRSCFDLFGPGWVGCRYAGGR